MTENLYRLTSEKPVADPLGTDAVRECARAIMKSVGDPKMHPSIPMKAARAVVDRKISPREMSELCEIIETKRKSGTLDKPGAYFLSSLRRLFQRNDVAW